MKIVQFKTLTLKNFLSFRSEVSVQLPNSGLHLVRGENHDLQNNSLEEVKNTNGSGKSALLRSLLWVLFGENNKRGKSDNVINKKSKRDTVVTVEFTVGDVRYKVCRYRKCSNGSGLSLYREVGGSYVDETFSDVKLTQEKLNELIGFNYETALYTVLVSKEYNVNLIESPWATRSAFLEGLLRVDALKSYVKTVKEKLSEDKKALSEHEKTYNAVCGSVLTLRSVLTKSTESRKKERTRDRLRVLELLAEYEKKYPPNLLQDVATYEKYYVASVQYKKLYTQLEKEKSNVQLSLDKYKKSKATLLRSRATYEEQQVVRLTSCEHCDKQLEVCATESVLSSLRNNVNLSYNHTVDLRHSCRQSLRSYRTLRETCRTAESTLPPRGDLQGEYVELAQRDLRSGVDPALRYGEQQRVENELSALRSKTYGSSELWSHLRSYWDEKRKKEKLQLQTKTLQRNVQLGEFWDATLDFRNEGSLKNYVVSKVVPVFNNVLKSVLDVVFEGKMVVTFDNVWNENVLYDGEEYDYSQLSLGEKGKLNLCVSLALFSLFRVNLGGTSLLFVDEGFSHIDEGSIEKFLQLLRSTYSKETAVFIVSHEYGLRNFVPDSTYVVTKYGGESTLRVL